MVDGTSEESNFGRNANAPTRTVAITHHETDRPGSSDATVPWCLRRPPNGWVSETHTRCVSTAMTRCNEPPIRYVCTAHDALRHRRVGSGSVQRGLSALRLPAWCYLAQRRVEPDGGKTLLR